MENLLPLRQLFLILHHYSGWKISSVLAKKGEAGFASPFQMDNFLETLYFHGPFQHDAAPIMPSARKQADLMLFFG
jgi:hypothetical protein